MPTLSLPKADDAKSPNESRTQYAQVHTPRVHTASSDATADASVKIPNAAATSLTKKHRSSSSNSHDDNAGDNATDNDKPAALPPVPLSQLYRYATLLDKLLLALGIAMAGTSGALFPCMGIVFGDAIAAFSHPNVPVDTDAINTAALHFFLIAVALFVTDYGAFVLFSITAERQVKALRADALQHMLHMDISWFDCTDALQLSSRLTGDTVKIKSGMGQRLGDTCKFACQFVTGYTIGFAHGWDMTLLMACVVPVMAGSLGYIVRVMRARTEFAQQVYARAGAVAEETLGSIRTVASLNGEPRAIATYDRHVQRAEAENIDLAKLWSAMFGVVMASVWVVYAVGLWYGGAQVAHDDATPAQIFQVFFGVLLGTISVAQIGPNIGAVAQARGAAAALFQILDTPSAIDASVANGIVPDACSGQIDIVGVTFAYPSRPESTVLTNYSVSIASGETVAFVGASGSGKSTLVALLERFYDPSSGAILLDGRDIRALNVAWLRAQIGLVAQEPVLFATTIAANIAASSSAFDGAVQITREQVVAAAKRAHAHAFIMSLPQQYDTLVGENGVSLSGGQKQRVAIARAIVRRPRILVLDEATSALDTESERAVQTALNELINNDATTTTATTTMHKTTTLVIAHRLSTIRRADKIVVLARGAVVEEGTHDALLAIDDGVYRRLYTTQEAMARDDAQASVRAYEDAPPSAVDDDSNKNDNNAQTLSLPATAVVSPNENSNNNNNHKDKDKGDDGDDDSSATTQFSIRDAMAFSRPERRYFVVGMLAAAINGFAMPLSAVLISEIVVRMTTQHALFARTLDHAFLDALMRDMTIYGSCYVAGAVGVFLVTSVQSYCFKLMAEKLTTRLRTIHFAALCRQNVAFFDDATRHATGALTADLATHAAKVALVSGDAQGRVVQATFTFVAAIAISFATGSWLLTLIMLAVFPLLMLGHIARLKQMRSGGEALSDELADVGAHASEALRHVRTVAALGMESALCARFVTLLDAPLRHGRREAHVNGLAMGGGSFAMFGAYALVFWYGGSLVRDGDITLKQLLRTLLAIMMSAQGVGSAVSFLGDSDHALKAGRAIVALRDRDVPIDAFAVDAGAQPLRVDGDIELRDVTFRYPTRPHVAVLERFNLVVKAGETVALCGPSGGGKSTLVALLERFYDVSSGHVLLDGVDVRTLNVRWLRRHVGLVSQEPTLFTGTIADNIAYGGGGFNDNDNDNNNVVTRDAIEAAAKLANAHDFITQFPDGYDTQVGAQGAQLSGGQKQRIAIARAIVLDPPILLLDEATSALDAESEQQVQAALDNVLARTRRTTIVIAHRLSTIRSADKICVVSGGRVAEQGSHAELLALGGIYTRLVERTMR